MTTHTRGPGSVRRLGRPPRGWVRKNLHIDQRQLNVARKALGVKTETEAVDAALDAIAFRQEISEGIQSLRAAGGLKDIYQD
jgi:Arc/MetJ family transcription regulator